MLEQVNGNWNVGELVYPCMSVKVRIMSNMITDKKALRLFFIITIIMSVIFEGGYIISSYVKGTQSLLIMLGLMWTPGIVTSFVYYKKQNAMGTLGRSRAMLVGGIIWACWHMPLIIAGLYQSETVLWYGLPTFAIEAILLSGVMAWLQAVLFLHL